MKYNKNKRIIFMINIRNLNKLIKRNGWIIDKIIPKVAYGYEFIFIKTSQ